jgi:hypothetical protein
MANLPAKQAVLNALCGGVPLEGVLPERSGPRVSHPKLPGLSDSLLAQREGQSKKNSDL